MEKNHHSFGVKRRLLAAALLALILSLAPGGLESRTARAGALGKVRVHFINVWQGDAALLQDSGGHAILVDGGLPQAGAAVVEYLVQQGALTIDVMVISHADVDHMGGLIAVLQAAQITTRRIIYNGLASSSTEWAELVAAASARGLALEQVRYPDSFTVGEMNVQVLNPAPGETAADIDDTSLVLRVDHGQVRFLFTGDIGGAGEQAVLGRGISPAAQVLKVAHHGSSAGSSSAFLAVVQPHDSVISSGLSNLGYPSAATLQRLKDAGSAIWRTDQLGTIVVTSDGAGYTFTDEELPYRALLAMVVR